jgi:hypothetical protein
MAIDEEYLILEYLLIENVDERTRHFKQVT